MVPLLVKVDIQSWAVILFLGFPCLSNALNPSELVLPVGCQDVPNGVKGLYRKKLGRAYMQFDIDKIKNKNYYQFLPNY